MPGFKVWLPCDEVTCYHMTGASVISVTYILHHFSHSSRVYMTHKQFVGLMNGIRNYTSRTREPNIKRESNWLVKYEII